MTTTTSTIDRNFLTGVERTFGKDEIIVSKTDPKGRIIYANEVFFRIGGYNESETLGQPHSFIRHPHMPRCIFKLLWSTIESRHEIFAYVMNRSKNGDHYWVLAHVTPTFDRSGSIVSYHSNRRSPDRSAIAKVSALYNELYAIERGHTDRRVAVETSYKALQDKIAQTGVPYDEFVLAL